MTAALHLIRIELRRNIGLWLFPPLVVVTIWVTLEVLTSTVWLWIETSYALLYSVLILGPLVGAFSAWVAGRERRHRLEDLLISVPRAASTRKLATWAGTAGWGVLVYLSAFVGIGAVTGLNATWGRPYFSVLLVGLTAIAAHSAVGFAAGTMVPSRFTAPVVGVALYVAHGAVTFNPTAIEYLSPVPNYMGAMEIFYQPRSALHLAQIAWFVGLSGAALGLAFLSRQRSTLHIVATAGAVLLATGGAGVLISISGTSADGPAYLGAEASYTPVCEDQGIPVCVHPAYESMLSETSELIGALTAPLASVPGTPVRAEQLSAREVSDTQVDGVLTFELRTMAHDGSGGELAGTLAKKLVNAETWYAPEDLSGEIQAKQVVANWLMTQAGVPVQEQIENQYTVLNGYRLEPEAEAAFERFVVLDDEQRRAWLKAHFPDLRAGRVSLEDLP